MKFFLDKDIIMRYSRKLLLNHRMPKKQFELMKEIQEGKHKVWISNNTPFAVLNYLKYRAQDKHGLDKPEEEADKIAKGYYGKIFGQGRSSYGFESNKIS